MSYQDAFNVVFALCGALGGWLLHTVWDALKDLRKEDKELADKVAAIEVVVAGQYVKRDEFEIKMTALFAKLDRIEDKLDGKADK